MKRSKEMFLSLFDQMDKANREKDKYMLLSGFMKGIVFSNDSAEEKIDDLISLSDALDESLYKELIKYQNKTEQAQSYTKTIITNKETGEIYTLDN
jgi:hypothetical protein